MRSKEHYDKFLNDNPNCNSSQLSSNAGYSTFKYNHLKIKTIKNIHYSTPVDINHSVKNHAEQIMHLLNSEYLTVMSILIMYFACCLHVICMCSVTFLVVTYRHHKVKIWQYFYLQSLQYVINIKNYIL